MSKFTLKYVVSDKDCRGNTRWYYRAPGQKKVRLRAIPDSDAFLSEYHEAKSGASAPTCKSKKIKPGTVSALIQNYRQSRAYRDLAPSTRKVRDCHLEKTDKSIGEVHANRVTARNIRKWRDAPDGPEAGNSKLKVLRQIFNTAFDDQLIDINPTVGIKCRPKVGNGHVPWTLADVKQFIGKHPPGTMAYVALCMFLFTGQRVSDVRVLGPQHRHNDEFKFTQAKNRHRKPVTLTLPIIEPLARVLASVTSSHLAYIISERDKPFQSDKSLSQRFSKWCVEAGIRRKTAHGIRKGLAGILAELELTPHQIGSVLGHSTLKEVERYSKGARQKTLARGAMKSLQIEIEREQIVPLFIPKIKVGLR
ncbi:MAG: tyrosine-type recombinase/integrase [Maricaulis sp.]|nr:tyrosine-type recombinase/integrase [Maricaulis sp.]